MSQRRVENILVRLPNWLGDMVMAYPFLYDLRKLYPKAHFYIICKKGLEELVPLLAKVHRVFPFSKKEYPGIWGAWKFGRKINSISFDQYYSLPDSFSAAVMGWATGAIHRIGYNTEMRSFLLSQSLDKPKHSVYRPTVYQNLLPHESLSPIVNIPYLSVPSNIKDLFPLSRSSNLLFNVNSNAPSRTLPIQKAVEFIRYILLTSHYTILLPGTNAEVNYVKQIINQVGENDRLINLSGQTNLLELISVIAQCEKVISVDTGIPHLANVMGKEVQVFWGAGDKRVTAPLFASHYRLIEVPHLACAPCTNNYCKIKTLECLNDIDKTQIKV